MPSLPDESSSARSRGRAPGASPSQPVDAALDGWPGRRRGHELAAWPPGSAAWAEPRTRATAGLPSGTSHGLRMRSSPTHSTCYDANIFHPHRDTLAFSEANLGAGVLAVPAWIATRNPFAAHNVVVLFAFAASVVFTWLLARRLTGDGPAAATAAALFAFCPYVFAHTAHIQLLMIAGIPMCMLAFHRLVDAPSPGRGVVLGVALAVLALSSAYYGISAGLTIGYATLYYAWSRRLWTSTPLLAGDRDCRASPRSPASCRSFCRFSRFRRRPASRGRSTTRAPGRRTCDRTSPPVRTPTRGCCRSSKTGIGRPLSGLSRIRSGCRRRTRRAAACPGRGESPGISRS